MRKATRVILTNKTLFNHVLTIHIQSLFTTLYSEDMVKIRRWKIYVNELKREKINL